GTAVINADNPQINILLEAAAAAGVSRIVTYGFSRGVDWQILDPQSAADKSFAQVINGEDRYALALDVPGRHMLSNATAALIVGHLAGIEAEVSLRALAGFGAQPGRGERIRLGPDDNPLVLVDESYNANTASIRAALDVFSALEAPAGRKVLVLGDMLELGDESEALHASLADS